MKKIILLIALLSACSLYAVINDYGTYVRGTFNDWDKSSELKRMPISPAGQSNSVCLRNATFGNSGNERFKIDASGDWSENYGDSNNDGILDLNGSSIHVEGGKTYNICVNTKTNRYIVTESDKSDYVSIYVSADPYSLNDQLNNKEAILYKDGEYFATYYVTHWTYIHGAKGDTIVMTYLPYGDYEVVVSFESGGKSYRGKSSFTVDETTTGDKVMKVSEVKWERTIIMIEGQTVNGQDMFVRGGIDHGYANNTLQRNCTTSNVECAMPIRYLNTENSTTDGWKDGDHYLDWYGKESTQQNDDHGIAKGSPLDWTTNAWPSDWGTKPIYETDGYGETPLNTYGHHYWIMEVEMDCSKAVNGWFELKSYISNGPGWEGDVSQSGTPYSSGNHFAKCGYKNVFKRGSNSAEITPLD